MRGSTATGCSADAVKNDSKSSGLRRTYAASKRVSSASLPLKILTCPFSVADAGWKFTVPLPSSTTAVTPPSISATKTEPSVSVRSRSSAATVRSWAVNCLPVVSDTR